MRPHLGWEKCYVLGKESAASEDLRFRTTGDHPRATTTGHALAQPLWTGSAGTAKTPLSSAGDCAGHPVGTHLPRLPAGCRAAGVMDRAWLIVVHSEPPHKGLVTYE